MKEGWKVVKLGDVCTINYGTRVVRNRDGGTTYPVYGGGGATFMMDVYNRENCVVVSRFAMSEQCTRYIHGKFFLNDSGLTLMSKDSLLSQEFLNLQILFLNNAIFQLGRGAAQKNLDTKAFVLLELKFPVDIEEQHRIVKKLDAAFEKIDAMKAKAEKNIENAKALFQQTLAAELEPKEGWVEKKLGDVCESCLGKTLNSSLDTGLQYNYLCAVNVQWDKFDLSKLKTAKFNETEREKYTVVKGDLLVCEGGETGRAAIWDSEETILYQNALHRIRFKNNEIYSRYCLFYLMNLKFGGRLDKEFSRGATIKHLVTKSLHSIPFAYPNFDIQQQIVTKLDILSAKCKKLEEAERKTIAECDALKQAILRQVFNGEL